MTGVFLIKLFLSMLKIKHWQLEAIAIYVGVVKIEAYQVGDQINIVNKKQRLPSSRASLTHLKFDISAWLNSSPVMDFFNIKKWLKKAYKLVVLIRKWVFM